MNIVCRFILFTGMIFFLTLSQGVCNETDKLVINREDIKGYNARTIYDLLNRLPGLKAGSTSLTIRGSSKVKAFMDGKPLNDPTSSHGGIKWDAVDLRRVDKIYILKGKGGVEFGDDASGGVVDIIMQPMDSHGSGTGVRGNFETYAGNLGTQSVKAGIRGQKDKLGLGLTFGIEETNGYRINHDKEKKRIEAKTTWTVSKKTRINGSITYFDEEKGNSGLPGHRTPNSRSSNDMTSGLIRISHGKLKTKTYASRGERRTKDPDRNLSSFLKVLEIGQEFSLPLAFDGWGPFNTGAGYEYATGEAGGFDKQTEQKAYGFISKQVSVTRLALTLNIGARGIHYDTYEDTLNPEMSLGYSQGAFSCLFTAAQTANVPSFKKKYQETSTTRPNPDLNLEKATNFGLNFTWEPDDRFALSLSPFYNIIDDRISYVRANNGIGRYENLGQVTYKGVDVSLSLTPLEWLAIQSGYTYLVAKDDETGLWLSAKPRHRWVTSITLTPVENLTLGLTLKALSFLYTNSRNTETASGYTTLDMRCEYLLGRVRLFAEANNMLDKEYLLADGYDAAPFNWIMGVSYSF